MRAVGIIPARYDATRFPGKPLAEISGLPMLQHVRRGARQAKRLGEVIIATADERIADVCRGFGAEVVLDRFGFPLYFSRRPIPARRPHHPTPRIWQHVGHYGYRQEFLAEFAMLARTPAERAEGLEQLRALENGHRIRCAVIEGWESTPVDVPADIGAVEARLGQGG